MDEDMTRIELWAKIFTEPKNLFMTVASNGMHHGVGIIKDLKDEKVKMASGDEFHAGYDVAAILVKLIGPVPALPTPSAFL